jgi:hypothetical protein
VGDFGIAVMQDKAGLLTQTVRGMGTVGYVSPEQQYGLRVDERADQYSLAALCYELLAGKRPLGLFPPPSQLNRQLTHQLDTIVLRALAEEPKNRFPSVQEFVAALDQALAGSPRKARLVPKVLAAVMAILVVAGLGWIVRPGFKRDVRTAQRQAPVESIAPPAVANTVKPPDAGKPPDAPAKAAEQSPEFKKLVELRAYVIWVESGRPTGEEGEAAKEKNWLEAENQIMDQVKARAFKIWNQQGRPTDAAGEAVREKNMRVAEAQVLKETEEEMRRNPID